MISKLLKLKKNKLLFSLAITFFVVLLVDLFALGFNLIQILIVSNNNAKLANAFLGINIFAICLNVLFVIFFIVVLILKKFNKVTI